MLVSRYEKANLVFSLGTKAQASLLPGPKLSMAFHDLSAFEEHRPFTL